MSPGICVNCSTRPAVQDGPQSPDSAGYCAWCALEWRALRAEAERDQARADATHAAEVAHVAALVASLEPHEFPTVVARARLVADHWHRALLAGGDQQMPWRIAAHPVGCVLAALSGETDPAELGIALDTPEGKVLLAAHRTSPAAQNGGSDAA